MEDSFGRFGWGNNRGVVDSVEKLIGSLKWGSSLGSCPFSLETRSLKGVFLKSTFDISWVVTSILCGQEGRKEIKDQSGLSCVNRREVGGWIYQICL